MCRHYHDLLMMAEHGNILNTALNDDKLLEDVVTHKKQYFKDGWDWYPTAQRGSFKLLPSKHLIKALENDYQKTKVMFFGNVMSFTELVRGLEALEDKINSV